jgi:FKBP-type peptidyl-prolyl cis-trans isomerase
VRTRSHVRFLTAALVAAGVILSGCGSDSSSESSAGSGLGFDSVTISGDVGTDATIKFSGEVTDSTQDAKVLTEGTGDTVKQGDSLILQTVIADGTTQKTVASSYQDNQPQVVTLSSQVQKLFLDALQDKTIGSRVAVSAPADAIFGPSGNAQLGISQKDPILIVFDLIGKPVEKPDGRQHSAPSWAPRIEKTKGVISGLDFGKTPKPDGKLHSAAVYDGTGPVVQKGQTIFARYLGEVYNGKKPFDENFSGDTPATFQIGTGGVIKGWDKTLVGQHVGSEVLLAIPPKDGYGKKGQPSAGIKGTDTLYFVVDIVGAA